MANDKRNSRSVKAAVLAASLLMLVFGATYHTLAMQLEQPATVPVAPDALTGLPMQMADWTGEDVSMDETLVRATDTDAHVNRHYSRKGGRESVNVFVGCSFSAVDKVIHRPEVCYPRSGWTPLDSRSVELSLNDGIVLPCTVLRFSRPGLATEQTTVLHYYIADGKPYANVSVLGPRLWRLSGKVSYVARVLITTSSTGLTSDSAEKMASDFAIDSAPSIVHLFETLRAERQSTDPLNTSEGNR